MHISSGKPRVVGPQVSVNPESQCDRYVYKCCDKALRMELALGSWLTEEFQQLQLKVICPNRIPTTLKKL